MQLCKHIVLAALIASVLGPQSRAQEVDIGKASGPEFRQGAQFTSTLKLVREFYAVRADRFQVEGERVLSGAVLAAEEVVFEEGSILSISANPSIDGAVYIIADKIVVRNQAMVTWDRDLPIDAPAPRAKAPGGSFGRGEGEPGWRGVDGEPGNLGFDGAPAPSLFVIAREIGPGRLVVDLRGQDGGPGGMGQDGGDGGHGGSGRSASASILSCKSMGGAGGRGGDGGNGGAGGSGGQGGAGGDLYLLTSETASIENLRVHASGGQGGAGGLPGSGGQPGRGGNGGKSIGGVCGGFQAPSGPSGKPGSSGPVPGKNGSAGVDGGFFVSRLNERTLNTIAE